MPAKGIERVRRNIHVTLKSISEDRTQAALYAVLSQGAALAAVRTPVDTSTLINSQYAPQITKTAAGMTGQVGYTASYAGAVHDAPGKMAGQPRPGGRGAYWSPNAEPRFLEKGFEVVIPRIPDILRAIYAR